jgi:ribosome-binding ATPase YchF (GTP1/OBG family)
MAPRDHQSLQLDEHDHEALAARKTWEQATVDASLTTWQDVVVDDWHTSMKVIHQAWEDTGGCDGLLGFSNGAAAAFCLIANAICPPQPPTARDPTSLPGLKFVIFAGGYLPDPLSSLIPSSLVESQGEEGPLVWLRSPLTLPSFHFMGRTDEAVPLEASMALAQSFSSPTILVHDGGHLVPTSPNAMSSLSSFLAGFQPATLPSFQPPSKPHPQINSNLKPPLHHYLKSSQTLACATDVPLPPPSQDQIDEVEALQSIFGDDFQLLGGSPSSSPFVLSIILQRPEGFQLTLTFTLPPLYPEQQVPIISLATDPLILMSIEVLVDLHSYLISCARELMDVSGAGCLFQLVEAAREFMDANPQRFILQPSVKNSGRVQAACKLAEASAGGEDAGDSSPLIAVAAEVKPWWEEEEADGELIRAAILKASIRHWGGFGGRAEEEEEEEGDGIGDDPGASYEEDRGLAQRGRWDYIIGLVGKPSAGKSTFFNACCVDSDPTAGAGSEARCASFPFTTIDPNISRGMIAVPEPAASIPGLPFPSRPTHGFASSFDPLRSSDPTLFNLHPLRSWIFSEGSPNPFFPWLQTSEGQTSQWRKVPVLVKDVAGLVPGAYQGRGKGNSFLNDLTDADVLIHVVDASGSTDKEGQSVGEGQGGGSDPLDDIGWVREEIHRWVFDNVRSKWSSCIKRPSKLPDLFSGYKASRSLVHRVLRRVGLNPDALESAGLSDWQEADLHHLVATFLQVRFPIMLAMNKADMRGAIDNIRRVRKAIPHEPMVSLSAAAERWLCAEARSGRISYEPGGNKVEMKADQSASMQLLEEGEGGGDDEAEEELATTDSLRAPSHQLASNRQGVLLVARKAKAIEDKVLRALGSTGTLLCLTTAVAMRPPRVAFPVGDLHRCTALPAKAAASGSNQGGASNQMMGAGADAKLRAQEGSNPSVLRDTLLLKPGSSVHDLYYTLKRPPWALVEGDYIRSDCRVMASASASGSSVESRVLKKDEAVGWDNCVIRIMTNRKISWQRG